jgi:hypothetical protein
MANGTYQDTPPTLHLGNSLRHGSGLVLSDDRTGARVAVFGSQGGLADQCFPGRPVP